jgi:hypothetical protein
MAPKREHAEAPTSGFATGAAGSLVAPVKQGHGHPWRTKNKTKMASTTPAEEVSESSRRERSHGPSMALATGGPAPEDNGAPVREGAGLTLVMPASGPVMWALPFG